MHEIRATLPTEYTEEAARLAHGAGIERVLASPMFISMDPAFVSRS